MAEISKEQFALWEKQAKQEIVQLKKDRKIVIPNSKMGYLTYYFDVNNGFITIYCEFKAIFKSDCEQSVINFLVNDVYFYVMD